MTLNQSRSMCRLLTAAGTVLLGTMLLGQVGCQNRVVREKSYYAGQFSQVSAKRTAPKKKELPKAYHQKEPGLFLRMWNSAFGGGKKTKVYTVEEMREMHAQRKKEKRTQSDSVETQGKSSEK